MENWQEQFILSFFSLSIFFFYQHRKFAWLQKLIFLIILGYFREMHVLLARVSKENIANKTFLVTIRASPKHWLGTLWLPEIIQHHLIACLFFFLFCTFLFIMSARIPMLPQMTVYTIKTWIFFSTVNNQTLTMVNIVCNYLVSQIKFHSGLFKGLGRSWWVEWF